MAMISLRQLLDHAAEHGYGVPALNVNNDATRRVIRRAMNKDRSEFDPCKFLKDATAAARDVCVDRFQAFGCAGMASRIKPVALESYARA